MGTLIAPPTALVTTLALPLLTAPAGGGAHAENPGSLRA
jgi:hypothetical protein